MTVKALLVVNRHSRLGETDLTSILEPLKRQGHEVVEQRVDQPADIPAIIRGEAPAADLVILAGGDGTMNAAAEALVEAGRPLAILPTGTGNDLARTLQIPDTPERAIEVILSGRPHPVDLGRVNGKLFFNVASVGLSAEVTRHHTVERKRRWWLFGYVLSVIDAYRATHPFRARLRCDGRRIRLRALQIAIANGRHYGGGMTVIEDAAIDDQRLDVYCIRPLSFWRLLSLFPALRFGRLRQRREVLVVSGREIELTTSRPMPINTDGEVTGRTPARFEVVPAALSILVPPTYAARQEADARVA